MSRGTRKLVLVAGALGVFAMLLAALLDAPAVGHYAGVYGATLVQVATAERHATDVVTAVNFDYRGFDTLGEEFILFSSVLGVAALLRKHRDEEESDDGDDHAANRAPARTSDAIRVLAVALVGLNVCFGLYVTTHGQISPGGGFQGGVILATAPVVVYLSADPTTFARIAPEPLVKAVEALGAAAYVILGGLAFLRGAQFLTNVLPLGAEGDVLSSGTIIAINDAVGLEVAAGFVSLLLVFVEEALHKRLKRSRS